MAEVIVKPRFVIFRNIQGQGPTPVVIEESQETAIQYIAEAQAAGYGGGWSYKKVNSRERSPDRVIAGRLNNYRVSHVNDPNVR